MVKNLVKKCDVVVRKTKFLNVVDGIPSFLILTLLSCTRFTPRTKPLNIMFCMTVLNCHSRWLTNTAIIMYK